MQNPFLNDLSSGSESDCGEQRQSQSVPRKSVGARKSTAVFKERKKGDQEEEEEGQDNPESGSDNLMCGDDSEEDTDASAEQAQKIKEHAILQPEQAPSQGEVAQSLLPSNEARSSENEQNEGFETCSEEGDDDEIAHEDLKARMKKARERYQQLKAEYKSQIDTNKQLLDENSILKAGIREDEGNRKSVGGSILKEKQIEEIVRKHKLEIADIETNIQKLREGTQKRIEEIESMHILGIENLKSTHMQNIEELKLIHASELKAKQQALDAMLKKPSEGFFLRGQLDSFSGRSRKGTQATNEGFGSSLNSSDSMSVRGSNDFEIRFQESCRRIHLLEEQVTQLTDTVKEKNEILTFKSAVIEEKNRMIEMNGILIAENEDVIEICKVKIEKLDEEIIDKEQRIAEIEVELIRAKSGAEKVAYSSQQSNTAIKDEYLNQLEEVQAKLEKLEIEIRVKEEAVTSVKTEVLEREEQLKTAKEETERQREEATKKGEQVAQLSNLIERLSGEQSQQENEADRLQKMLIQAQLQNITEKSKMGQEAIELQNQLKNAVSQYVKAIEEKEGENQRQAEQIHVIVGEINELNEKEKESKGKIEDLTTQVGKAKEERVELEKQLDVLKTELERSEAILTQEKVRIEKLEIELQQAKDAKETIEKEISEKGEEMASLRAEVQRLTSENQETSKQIQEFEKRLETAVTALEESQSLQSELRIQLNESTEQLAQSKQKLEETVQRLEGKQKEAEIFGGQTGEKEQALLESSKEIERLSTELATKTVAINESHLKIEAIELASSLLSIELASEKDKLSQSATESATLRQTILELESSKREVSEEITETKKELNELKTEQKVLEEAMKKQAEEVKSQSEINSKLVKELYESSANLEEITSSNSEKKEVIEGMNVKVSSLTSELSEAKVTVALLGENNKELKQQIQVIEAQKERFMDTLNSKDSASAGLNVRVGQLEQQVEAQSKKIENQKEKIKVLKESIETKEKKVGELSKALEENRKDVEKLSSIIEEKEKVLLDIEARLKQKDSEISVFTEKEKEQILLSDEKNVTIVKLEKQLENEQVKVKESEEDSKDKQTKVDELTRELVIVSGSKKLYEEESGELRQMVLKLQEQQTQQSEAHQEKIQAITSEKSEFSESLLQLRSEIEDLTSRLTSKDNEFTDAENTHQMEQLRLTETANSLREQLESQSEELERLCEVEDQLAEEKMLVEGANGRLKNAEEKIKSSAEMAMILQEKLKTAEQQAGILRQQLKNKQHVDEDQQRESRKSVSILQSQAEMSKYQAEAARTKQGEVENEMKRKIEDLNAQLSKLLDDKKNGIDAKIQLQKERESMVAEKERALRDIQQLYQQSRRNEDNLQKRIDELERVILVLNNEAEGVKKQLARAQHHSIEQSSSTPLRQGDAGVFGIGAAAPFAGLVSSMHQSQEMTASYSDTSLSNIGYSSKDVDDDKIVLADLAQEIIGLIQQPDQNLEGGVFTSSPPNIQDEQSILSSLQKIKAVIQQKLTQDLANLSVKNTQNTRASIRKHLIIIIKEINRLNEQHGIDRWRRVSGVNGERIAQQVRAIDEFTRQFSGVLLILESKSVVSDKQSQQPSIQAAYSEGEFSQTAFNAAKMSFSAKILEEIASKVEQGLQGDSNLPTKPSADVAVQLKKMIQELVKKRKSSEVQVASVEFPLVMISTENSEIACAKYINDYLAKIPESEKWKSTLAALFRRYAFACVQSKNPTNSIIQVTPIISCNSQLFAPTSETTFF